jgi:hypothetical protein
MPEGTETEGDTGLGAMLVLFIYFPTTPKSIKEIVLETILRELSMCVCMSCHQRAWHNDNLTSGSNMYFPAVCE